MALIVDTDTRRVSPSAYAAPPRYTVPTYQVPRNVTYRPYTAPTYTAPTTSYAAPTTSRRVTAPTYTAPTRSYVAPRVSAAPATGGGLTTSAPTPPATTPTAPAGGVVQVAPPVPPILNYPAEAQQQAFVQQFGIPGLYANWFAYTIAPFAEYYTAARGGEVQAQADYRNLLNTITQRLGRAPTPDELASLMAGFSSYAQRLGRAATVPDLFDYVNRYLWGEPRPPQIAYLRVGEF